MAKTGYVIIDPEDITKLIMYTGMLFGVFAVIATILYIMTFQREDSLELRAYLLNMILMTAGVFGISLAFWNKYG